MGKLTRVNELVKKNGIWWTSLYARRAMLLKFTSGVISPWLACLEKKMIGLEKKHFITGWETASAHTFTDAINRKFYDRYDWSAEGEEWTEDVGRYRGLDPDAWKNQLIDECLRKYVPTQKEILEIGPGAGRWTEVLKDRCSILHLADISKTCLDLCQERFKDAANIRYHQITDGTLKFLPENSLDGIWSYDVFVHINPTEIERYVKDFAKVLKPGGVGVIHHAGAYPTDRLKQATAAGRSPMTGPFFAELVRRAGLVLLEQNTSLPHFEGDVISIFKKG